MDYQSLYRRYRPATFDEIVGQTAVVRTLTNAIAEGRLHHAYLFTGPRGTGKTSIARILAKAINCSSGPTPTPCGTCEACTTITEGTSLDVIELDMASHGGVDDARDLRERALFAPATGRMKVYILDEVHMASTAAFNALLKLVEEPPGHVLFAMATTDPQKVLPTILSRVQRLDLRRVDAPSVAAHVRRIVAAEGSAIADDALEAVVRAGDGSVRDTLSILEQVLAFAQGPVTLDDVTQTLGATPMATVVAMGDLVEARDLAGVLGAVQGLVDAGLDLRRFTLDLVAHLRDLLVLNVAPDRPDLVDATEERRAELLPRAQRATRESLVRAIGILGDSLAEQRGGPPRLPLELALARLVVPGDAADVASLAERVARLEAGAPVVAASPAPAPTGSTDGTAPAAPAATAPAAAPTASSTGRSARAGGRTRASAAAGVEAESEVAVPVAAVPVAAPEPVGTTVAPAPAPAAAAPDARPAPVAGAPAADAPADGDGLAAVVARWDAVLELVKAGSPRARAVFDPAEPVRLERGILTLRYGPRYSRFHAAEAVKQEFSSLLVDAVRRSCALEVRLEVLKDGDDDRRRPQPPMVTPADARPVLDPDDAAAVDAERGMTVAPASAADLDGLLAEQLGAQRVDE